ncbi:response regulator [Candidatus Contubernalis alkaliaceticus]|uniref:response regulator n=1 Tax=Candidatus Contubernalis alkaliaceticus TaxID=338645 RepID=UPI001F4C1F44|nr:response regulator [Candidatus Contubernalis alkalaceticus]UNC91354.1 response regulator [Candidatus Contubernalis alkalaceticus]
MDDERKIREVACEMLSLLGYESDFARDGAEAIEKYIQALEEGKPFDLVVMDLTIPGGMGGRETIKRLLKIDPTIKAIVSSGYSSDPVMSYYSEYGFSGVVSKPYKIEELAEVISKFLHSKSENA